MPNHSHLRLLGAALATAGAVTLAPAASAAPAPCDAYSQTCAPKPTTSVIGEKTTKPTPRVKGVKDTHTVLPFTGAQLTLLLAVGTAGVGAGTALTAAGRKRRHQA